jgi:dienelactone hydrolase
LYVHLQLSPITPLPQCLTIRPDTTGPSDAKRAILVIYDIFGFFPQTIQGADILAHSDKEQPYQVFMPDWFEGSPADISWYPPDNEEKGKKLGEFFQTSAAPPKTLSRIPKVVEEIKKNNSAITSWGILGYCWGGKVGAFRR